MPKLEAAITYDAVLPDLLRAEAEQREAFAEQIVPALLGSPLRRS